MDTATISILVVIIGCLFGLAEWVRTVKADSSNLAGQVRTLQTKVEHLEDQVTELKDEERTIEANVQKAIEKITIAEKTIGQDRLDI